MEPDRSIIEAKGLFKTYDRKVSDASTYALRDVSITVRAGEIVAVVGESGSGKTTLTRCLLGLETPSAGLVVFEGATRTPDRDMPQDFRRKVQPVFQDPMSSLDPRWTVRRTVRESLEYLGIGASSGERDAIVEAELGRVGLSPDLADRKPHQISGGQKQRVAIAAALACGPELLIADEPVTALDVSVQAQILNLFSDLRAELNLGVLFVSHDLSVVRHISDRVVVLCEGRVVEAGTTDSVLTAPQHAYTQQLLAAVPGRTRLRPGPEESPERRIATAT